MEVREMFAASSSSQQQVSSVDEAEELRSEARRLQHLAQKLELQAAELEKFRAVSPSGGMSRPYPY
jgi:hypothetical protein